MKVKNVKESSLVHNKYIKGRTKLIKTHIKQLDVIEGLCLCWENGKKDLEQAQIIIDNIYRTSHINKRCGNPHNDWKKELNKLHKTLQKEGLI